MEMKLEQAENLEPWE